MVPSAQGWILSSWLSRRKDWGPSRAGQAESLSLPSGQLAQAGALLER